MFGNGFFYSANDFYKEIFGSKVYKISLDAGCTCPNRDGSLSYGGCSFCSNSGSGDFASSRLCSIKEQVAQGKELVKTKFKSCENPKYIAYFQNFTSTYGETSLLVEKYKEAVSCDQVVGLSVATRPDCLGDDMLRQLKNFSEKNYVSVELGLQTSCEKTAFEMNRCYKNEVYTECVQRIKQIAPGIHVVTHLILGLPGESEAQMLESVDFSVGSGTDGLKISLLHVLRGTPLEKKYCAKEFECLSMDSYFEILGNAIKRIPSNIVIHRVTGDGPKRILVAPLWTGDKKKVMNEMFDYFRINKIQQGIN